MTRRPFFAIFVILAWTAAPLEGQTAGKPACAVQSSEARHLRPESLTELFPDVIVLCAGGVPNQRDTVDMQVFFNTQVTSRLISGNTSEALLLVNEPPADARSLGTNAFQGRVSGNLVQWTAPATWDGSGKLTLRVANLRFNLNALGFTSAYDVPLMSAMQLSIGGVNVFAKDYEVFSPGLVGNAAAGEIRQCDDSGPGLITMSGPSALNTGLLNGGLGQIQFNVRFRELVPRGFSNQQHESGTTLPSSPLIGAASHGTGLSVVFNNVPPGMSVYVTTRPVGPANSITADAVLIDATAFATGKVTPVAAAANGGCGLSGGTPVSMASVPINIGAGSAVWVVTEDDPAAFEQLSFGVALASATPLTGVPIVNIGLAPSPLFNLMSASAASAASSTLPIPRFADTSYAVSVPIAQGVTFVAVAGGGAVPDQSVPMVCGAPAVSTSSGGNWLSAKASQTALTVSAQAAGLSPKTYFGRISCANGSALTIVLNVVAGNIDPGPVVDPIGFIFAAPQGASTTDAQTVSLYNLTSQPIQYTMTNPAGSGTVTSGAPVSIPLRFNAANLAPGIYTETTHILFSDGFARDVVSRIIVTPAAGASSARQNSTAAPRAGVGCEPNQLTVVAVSLGPQIGFRAGNPVTITARVEDNCHNPISTGAVVVTFSSEPKAVHLEQTPTPGLWSGLWTPTVLKDNMQLTITAAVPNAPLRPATQTIPANVVGGGVIPTLDGIVNAASQKPGVAPGGSLTIYGRDLADGENNGGGEPSMLTTLGTTSVLLAGRELPLSYAGQGQINAIVPFDLPPGNYPMQVTRLSAVSSPTRVTVDGAAPAVFTMNGSGQGQGAIVNALTGVIVDQNHPATAGDILAIYATGIGAVQPVVKAGERAPDSPLSWTLGESVRVSIGDAPAQVVFAGLAPRFAGLYQVNAVVPAGVATGPSVPVALTAGGAAAPIITIAVK